MAIDPAAVGVPSSGSDPDAVETVLSGSEADAVEWTSMSGADADPARDERAE
jgi:hypothetical protein